MTLIDTNVVLDVVTNDRHWLDWSVHQLDIAATRGHVAINQVIYAEISVRYNMIERLEAFLTGVRLVVVPIPRAALFLAGKAHLRYRASGGTKTGVLPDFFIGAHAAVARMPLVTRDVRRYRSYFPTIELITPETTSS